MGVKLRISKFWGQTKELQSWGGSIQPFTAFFIMGQV